jgi:tRNA(Arg) A34 adenosine deaminase TadA
MRRCLELARGARQAGETAVGSVVVRAGEVIGEGSEATRSRLDPSAHAEMEAIREACRAVGSLDLSGSTLYTTVEPCFLCGYAIRATRIERVVMGSDAGEVGAHGSRHAFLSDSAFENWGPPPEVVSGLLEDEARALLAGI